MNKKTQFSTLIMSIKLVKIGSVLVTAEKVVGRTP